MSEQWGTQWHEITSPREGDGWARLVGTGIEVQTFVRSGVAWVRYRAVPGTVATRPYDPEQPEPATAGYRCSVCGSTSIVLDADGFGGRDWRVSCGGGHEVIPYPGLVMRVRGEA